MFDKWYALLLLDELTQATRGRALDGGEMRIHDGVNGIVSRPNFGCLVSGKEKC